MKMCNTCKQSKPDSAFSYKNKAKGTRQSKCKACSATYSSQWHDKNKSECRECGQSKYRHDFAFKNKERGTKTICKQCFNLLRNEAYAALPPEERKAAAKAKRDRSKVSKPERQRRLLDYLKTHPCVDCGETDPVVLEFDHVRGDKVATVYTLALRHLRTWGVVEEEIAKCDVRCVKCHRKRTAKAQGWYKAEDGP